MKIFSNLPGAAKATYSLKYLRAYRKGIHEARAEGNNEKEREYILKATSTWGKKMLEIFGATLEVEGRENLPSEGPVVYMSNHQGYADIIAHCAALDTIQLGFVAKKELEKVPLYGPWIKEVRSVLIERDNPRESIKAISKGINFINEGFSLMIYPEGTRSKGPEMGEFKMGAMKLATKPGVPIIPISTNGTWRCFEEQGKMSGAKINLSIHPAVETKDLSKEEEHHLGSRIEEIIKKGVLDLQSRE